MDTVHASMQGSLDQLKTRLKSACDATDSPFPDFSNEPISNEELFEEPSPVQKIADLQEQLVRKQTLGEKTRSIFGRLFSLFQKTELSSDEILMGAVRKIQKAQIENREFAVQAITIANNLEAEMDKDERLLSHLKSKEAKDDDSIEEQERLGLIKAIEASLPKMKVSLLSAIELKENVKNAIREQETTIRRKAAETLVVRVNVTHSHRLVDVDSILSDFKEKSEQIQKQFALIEKKVAEMQSEVNAGAACAYEKLKSHSATSTKSSGDASGLSTQ